MNAQLHVDYYKAFEEAEGAIKKAEHAGEDLPIPSINELRYAGFHHAKADKLLSEGDESGAIENIQKAIRHANRARFDAYEFYIAVYSERVKDIFESFKGYEYIASRHIPNYKKHTAKLNEIGNMIENTNDMDKESKDYVERCEKTCRSLQRFVSDFRSVECALFSEIEESKSSKGRSWIQCIIGIVASFLLGFLVAIFF